MTYTILRAWHVRPSSWPHQPRFHARRASAAWVLAITTLILVSPQLSHAQAECNGPAFQVNSYTTGQQRRPQAARIDDGSFVVVWDGEEQDGDTLGVFAQRLAEDGTRLGTEFQVNTYTTGRQNSPDVTAAAGGFVVVWESWQQDGTFASVFGQRFANDGTPLGGELAINEFSTGTQLFPRVDSAADGTFVATWRDTDIVARRFDATGVPLGGNIVVSTYATGSSIFPDVAVAPDGSFVIAWMRQDPVGPANFFDVALRHFDDGGAPTADEFLVNSYTTGSQRDPSVAAATGGGFLLAWEGDLPPNPQGYTSAVAQRIDSAGLPAGANVPVNTLRRLPEDPSVAAVDDGYVVAWGGIELSGRGKFIGGSGVYAQRFTSTGEPIAGEFRVDTLTGDIHRNPAAAGGPGALLVAWVADNDGSEHGLFAQAFTTKPMCPDSPVAFCRDADTGEASLSLRDDAGSRRDKIRWSWNSGVPTPATAFLDPGTCSSQMHLCIYDASANPQPLRVMVVRPGLSCGKYKPKACWKSSADGSRSRYRDKTTAPDGIKTVKLQSRNERRAPIKLVATGARLVPPPTPLTLPVTVQLVVSDGVTFECWQAVYSAPTENGAGKFEGKSD